MAKKRFVKKSSSNFSIPESFNALNFNQKIIAVTLMVLVIGIIGSLFPGNVTGGSIFSNSMFSQVTYTLDNVIRTVFPMVPSANIIIYEKFVLFLLLFTLLSGAAKLLNFRGITNVVVAGSISLISVWFIPPEVLAMIGVTYGAVYASLLMLIPILTVGYLTWKIPGTRGGCGAKSVIFFILFVIFGATKDGITNIYGVGEWYNTYTETLILVLFISAIYYLIKAIFITPQAELAALDKWKKEKSDESIAGLIHSMVQENIKGGINEAKRREAAGRRT